MAQPTIAKNTTYFTAALTIQKILSFIYFWLVSNFLLPEQLGQYVFALSFTTLFSIFIDLGLSPVLTREASKHTNQANTYLKNVIGIKIPLSILTVIAAVLTIQFSGKPANVQLLVYLASFVMLLDSFSLSFWVIFRAQRNMKYESLATILVQAIIFTIGIIALKTSGRVEHLMLALVAASTFNFLFSLSLLKWKLRFSLWPEFNKDIVMHFLKILPAFAIAGIFVKIYNTSDSVLLSYLDSDRAVGLYAVPAKVVYSLQQVIPAAFAAVIFPLFSYYYVNSKKQLAATFTKAFDYLLIISVPVAAGIVTLVPEIIEHIWPRYDSVIPTFIVMAATIPFIFLAFPTGYLLNACDRQNNTTINRGIITILSVILNILLIPELSFFGAAITFFITNFILLFMDFYWVHKTVALDWSRLLIVCAKTVLAAATMVVSIVSAKSFLPLPIIVPFGALMYFAVLFAIGGLQWAEFTSLARRSIQR